MYVHYIWMPCSWQNDAFETEKERHEVNLRVFLFLNDETIRGVSPLRELYFCLLATSGQRMILVEQPVHILYIYRCSSCFGEALSWEGKEVENSDSTGVHSISNSFEVLLLPPEG